MTEPKPDERTRYRQWYDETFMPLYATWAPAVLAACILFSAFAMVSTYLQGRTQDKVTATLLECFDTYADNFTNVSKEVRAAQVNTDTVEARADEAAAERDTALQALLLLKPTSPDAEKKARFEELIGANAVLVRERDALVDARRRLRATRDEHPIPEPPSKFCVLPE